MTAGQNVPPWCSTSSRPGATFRLRRVRDGARPTSSSVGPYGLLGDTAQMVDALLERRERWGHAYLSCLEEDVDLFAPVVARLSGS